MSARTDQAAGVIAASPAPTPRREKTELNKAARQAAGDGGGTPGQQPADHYRDAVETVHHAAYGYAHEHVGEHKRRPLQQANLEIGDLEIRLYGRNQQIEHLAVDK